MFAWRVCLIPFFCAYRMDGAIHTGYLGWRIVRVFGFRVAQIQMTKPWTPVGVD